MKTESTKTETGKSRSRLHLVALPHTHKSALMPAFVKSQFCKFGHDTSKCGRNTQRYCRECARLRIEATRADPIKLAAERKRNQQRMKQRYAGDRDYREAVKAARRAAFHRSLIGCPPEPAFGSPCEICRRTDVRLRADHCHDTNKFRGWLCAKCNTGIGMLNDLPKLVAKAARYLSKKL